MYAVIVTRTTKESQMTGNENENTQSLSWKVTTTKCDNKRWDISRFIICSMKASFICVCVSLLNFKKKGGGKNWVVNICSENFNKCRQLEKYSDSFFLCFYFMLETSFQFNPIKTCPCLPTLENK